MALEDIIQAIEKEKEKKLEEIKKEKEKELSFLEKDYQKKLEKEKRKILEKEEKELQEKILAKKEELERKETFILLEEKRKKMEKVYQEAFEEIRKIFSEKEKEIFEKLFKKFLPEIEKEKNIEIICPLGKGKMIKEILEKFGKDWKVNEKEIGDGFIIKTKNFDLNCTFEKIFEKVKKETEIKVSKILF